MIGHMYFNNCCNCLRRMSVITMDYYNSAACCSSCRARWESLPDKSPLQKPSAGCCQVM